MSGVMVSMADLIRTYSSGVYTHPVSWNCAYHLRMELSDGGCFPKSVRNCRWTILPRQSFWITLYIYIYIYKVHSLCGRFKCFGLQKLSYKAVWGWHTAVGVLINRRVVFWITGRNKVRSSFPKQPERL